jgi:glyoxylase-like metal-dependent hydrolase (beta-lactamase superfamily II)
VAANRVDIVKSAHAFNDLVTLIPTPGHTIDHYSVQVGKSGADAIITGDMIHSPLQARYPELGTAYCADACRIGRWDREDLSDMLEQVRGEFLMLALPIKGSL